MKPEDVPTIDFTDEEYSKFRELKSSLGLSADTEVVRYAVNMTYRSIIKPVEAVP